MKMNYDGMAKTTIVPLHSLAMFIRKSIMEVAAKLTRDMAVPCFKGPTDFGKSKEMRKRIGRVQSAVAMTQDPTKRVL